MKELLGVLNVLEVALQFGADAQDRRVVDARALNDADACASSSA